jgi:CheY-like chemotaxis protein
MARVSCDVRTPLNAILGCSEILAAEEMTPEQRKHVKLIQSSARQLLDLVVDAIARCLGVEGPESATTCADGPRVMTSPKSVDANVLSPCLSDATAPGAAAGDGHGRFDINSTEDSEIQFLGHVLVADDNQIDRMIAQKLLEMLGAKVKAVKNGAEVVDITRRERYDLVLMDMEMPCMNGYEATRELRDLGMKLPIVALTGHAMKEDQAKCIAAGCDGYLAKPIVRGELMRVLQRYLAPQEPADFRSSSQADSHRPF